MSVTELIEELRKLPQDAQVILQKDAEGNGYSPLACVDGNAIYQPQNSWSGAVVDANWTWLEACYDSEKEWDDFKAASPRCCVLAPVN